MTDVDSDEELAKRIRALLRVQRHHAPDFAALGRHGKADAELYAVESLIGSMADPSYRDPRPSAADWPDVVSRDLNGREVAIEVTELVDSAAIAAVARLTDEQVRLGYRADRPWSPGEILACIQERIDKKDARRSGGSRFAESVLVICTAELYLVPDPTIALVRDRAFDLPHGNLDRVFLVFGYVPVDRHPYVELKLRRRPSASAAAALATLRQRR